MSGNKIRESYTTNKYKYIKLLRGKKALSIDSGAKNFFWLFLRIIDIRWKEHPKWSPFSEFARRTFGFTLVSEERNRRGGVITFLGIVRSKMFDFDFVVRECCLYSVLLCECEDAYCNERVPTFWFIGTDCTFVRESLSLLRSSMMLNVITFAPYFE